MFKKRLWRMCRVIRRGAHTLIAKCLSILFFQASHYISSIYCGAREGNRFVVTGGSDLRLRYWDLEHPEDSYVLLHAHNDTLRHDSAVKYRLDACHNLFLSRISI